jgi:iron-sulfur cluster repair protein YtfE (RIC family)
MVSRQVNEKRAVFATVLTQLKMHMQKTESSLLPHTIHKNESQTQKAKIIQLLGENRHKSSSAWFRP